MYFIAEESPDAKVPEGYSLCRVPDIDLQCGGDIDLQIYDTANSSNRYDIQPWFACENGDDDKAASIAEKMLQDPTKYMFWFSDINQCIYKDIITTKLGKNYGSGSFFLGKMISSDVPTKVNTSIHTTKL
jgi:hypothetical protein